ADKLAIERTFLVDRVKLARFVDRKAGVFQGHQLEALRKDQVQDLAGMARGHRLRRDHGERSVACHRRNVETGGKSSRIHLPGHAPEVFSSQNPSCTLSPETNRNMHFKYVLIAIIGGLAACS